MGFKDYRVSLESSAIPGHVVYNVTGPDSALLIGRDGRNLQALSKIVREIVLCRAHSLDSHFELENYVIDVDGYQEAEVKKLLDEIDKSIKQLSSAEDNAIELRPMTAFQRRIVHSYIQSKDLSSQSQGTGADRKVIISK
jgi:spoIIIJ-associated protein